MMNAVFFLGNGGGAVFGSQEGEELFVVGGNAKWAPVSMFELCGDVHN